MEEFAVLVGNQSMTTRALADETGSSYHQVYQDMRKGYCVWPRRGPGNTKDPAYKCWENMVQRTTNPKATKASLYSGVPIYPLWRVSFTQFRLDMGPRPSLKHSLDRVNPALGYVPGNVRWATGTTQNMNRRVSLRIEQGRNTFRFQFCGVRYRCPSLAEAVRLKLQLFKEYNENG